MIEDLVEVLICPACLPGEKQLLGKVEERRDDDIWGGYLQCKGCGSRYSIEEGIARLIPANGKSSKAQSKYESARTLSSYLWSHFADLYGDEDATRAYHLWASGVPAVSGFFLDAGCAVGRFTFELSQKADFAIGIDYSESFIRIARKLFLDGEIEFPLIQEGNLTEMKKIRLPEKWCKGNIEFIVADAMAVPFPRSIFSGVASLNLIDKLPIPLQHLREMNRVAKEKKAHLLFSDPFSWSRDICREENWLGGKEEGPFAGKSLENILKLLQGSEEFLTPPWNIDGQGSVWWKIRNHRNHFELIRSCFVKASR